ncbi:hypothetical protein E3J38_00915 [candidate division TA06 bacterium]|uniref:DNA binding HTH domain-containing protein n=1 Tax=candidate division TA06 bacterium TaxID=2250710 RepID=A0A523XVB5_UNCT6|nr:MAG: hypothetical protein E3J38_00915 [candidate division TA06 bacterium]
MKEDRRYSSADAVNILREILTPLVMKLQEAEDKKLYGLLMNSLDHSLVEYALEITQSQMGAAHLLGISRNTLRRKMAKYKLRRKSQSPDNWPTSTCGTGAGGILAPRTEDRYQLVSGAKP